MKILLACQQSRHTYALPAYGFWRTYFMGGLLEAGHEVVEVPDADWARGLLPLSARERARWQDEIWTRTLAVARQVPDLDLFLTYLYPQQIVPPALRQIRAGGLPAVNFFCDNVREYRRLPGEFSGFDLHWVPECDALPLYAARGWRTLFAPMPCWVPPRHRQQAGAEQPRIAFAGRRDDLRAALLETVARAGLPLVLSGGGWTNVEVPSGGPAPRWSARIADWCRFYQRQGPGPTWWRLRRAIHRPLTAARFDFSPWLNQADTDDDYAAFLAHNAVSLGINRYPTYTAPRTPPRTYSRLRDIEAPMLGACHLTEWAPELPLLYDLGVEIETFHDAAELIEKAGILLADPDRRRRMRTTAQQRALSEHSIGRTLERLAGVLGLSPRATIR